MADLKNRNWLVSPSTEVEKKWLLCSIQEKKSRIVRLKQDIEDIMNGQIVGIEAEIMMAEKELASLQEKYGNLNNSIEINKGE